MAFQFKQFRIEDDQCSMKVGTDSILLGSWAKAEEGSLVDIGSGCGLLSLMLAQRFPNIHITAIEFHRESFIQGKSNFESSHWPNRIRAIHADVKTWQPEKLFDHVICNPPYFIGSLSALSPERTNARQDKTLSYSELWRCIERITKEEAQVHLVSPILEFERLQNEANAAGWHLSAAVKIKKNQDDTGKLMLTKWASSEGLIENKELAIHTLEGEYSSQFKSLTGNFYL
jgi:tRNA1Val (adenine37-N6)-methyltransferase